MAWLAVLPLQMTYTAWQSSWHSCFLRKFSSIPTTFCSKRRLDNLGSFPHSPAFLPYQLCFTPCQQQATTSLFSRTSPFMPFGGPLAFISTQCFIFHAVCGGGPSSGDLPRKGKFSTRSVPASGISLELSSRSLVLSLPSPRRRAGNSYGRVSFKQWPLLGLGISHSGKLTSLFPFPNGRTPGWW